MTIPEYDISSTQFPPVFVEAPHAILRQGDGKNGRNTICEFSTAGVIVNNKRYSFKLYKPDKWLDFLAEVKYILGDTWIDNVGDNHMMFKVEHENRTVMAGMCKAARITLLEPPKFSLIYLNEEVAIF